MNLNRSREESQKFIKFNKKNPVLFFPLEELPEYAEGIEVGEESLAADIHKNFPNFELLEDQLIKEEEIELQADPLPEMSSPPRFLKPLNNNATMEAKRHAHQAP